MTEAPFNYAEKKENERYVYYSERHGKTIKRTDSRAGLYYLKDQEKRADIIMYQGVDEHFASLGKPTFKVFPNAFINDGFSIQESNKRKKNNKFLIYGVSNNWIRKGIDLAFEAFEKHPELELYICDRDLHKQAKKMGYNTWPRNIHDCGFIDFKSNAFLDLIYECSFIVLPSSFEGFPSSVVTGMVHGMIPIVTHGIGLDSFVEECFFFDDYKIESIEEKLLAASSLSKEEICKRSVHNISVGKELFSLSTFSSSFISLLDFIDGK